MGWERTCSTASSTLLLISGAEQQTQSILVLQQCTSSRLICMQLWILLRDYIWFYVAATRANDGLLFDRHRKKQSYCFSFQLPVHPDHGTWVLRMPRILNQHSSRGGEDWRIRVWGMRYFSLISGHLHSFCAEFLSPLSASWSYEIQNPVPKAEISHSLSCLPHVPNFLNLSRSVSPGPHCHLSSQMYISCTFFCFGLQEWSNVKAQTIFQRNVLIVVWSPVWNWTVTLGPGFVLQHDAKMKRKAIFQRFLTKEVLGNRPPCWSGSYLFFFKKKPTIIFFKHLENFQVDVTLMVWFSGYWIKS